MPVHMMGQPCHLERIMAIARKHNLAVIEDACQAHLAEYRGKKLGTIGDCWAVSAFQTSKTIACGEGGAIIGDDESAHGQVLHRPQPRHLAPGAHGSHRAEVPDERVPSGRAAWPVGQARRERFARRNENAARLTSGLKGCRGWPRKNSTPAPPAAPSISIP